jgi:flagellar motor switch protein FliG
MALDQASSGIRQAAILLASVDSATARQLMQQMPAAMVKAVRKAMVELGRIDSAEQKAVLAAFHSTVRRTGDSVKSDTITPRAESSAAGIKTSDALSIHEPRFSTTSPAVNLSQGDWGHYSTEQILDCLVTERPTVVAVVLSQLDPPVANQVLSKLPSQLKTDVLLQLSRLQHIDADILHDIKEQLQNKLATTRPAENMESDLGLPKLKSILEAGGEKLKAELCQALQQAGEVDGSLKMWLEEQLRNADRKNSDKALGADTSEDHTKSGTVTSITSGAKSSDIRLHQLDEESAWKGTPDSASRPVRRADRSELPPEQSSFDAAFATFEFDDLKRIDLNDLATILQNCDPRALLISLSGADNELMQRISLLFSPRDWKRLKDRLRTLGHISVDDQIMARRFVAEAAQALIDETMNHKVSTKMAGSENYAKAA